MDITTHAKMVLQVQPEIQKPRGPGTQALTGEKVGATAEQLSVLRNLASKIAPGTQSKGGLMEMLPEAKPVASKSFAELMKGMMADAKTQGIGKAFNSMVAGVGERFGGSPMMGVLGGEIGGAGGAMGGAIAGPIGIAAVAAVGAAKKILDEIIELPDKFMAAAQKVAGYVQAANPAVVDRFNLAVKDTTAILGHGLTPLMETFTDVVRSVADGLASSDLVGSMKDLFGSLKDVFADIKPHISIIVKLTVDMVAGYIRMAAWMIRIIRIANALPFVGAIGLAASRNLGVENSSFGMSAQQASMMGAEEFSRKATIAAFSTGADPARATADNTARIATAVERWLPVLGNLATGNIPGAVAGLVFQGG